MCGVRYNLHEENNLYIINPEKHVIVEGNLSCAHKTISKQSIPKENLIVDKKVKQKLISEQFNSLLVTRSIQGSNHFQPEPESNKNTKPKHSSCPKVEIDEKLLDLIEGITTQNPNYFVSLKKTKSGRLSLGHNSVSEDNDIIIKKSPSGNMIIEIDKNAIQTSMSKKKPNDIKFFKNEKTKKTDQSPSHIRTPTYSENTEVSLDNDRESLSPKSEDDSSANQTKRKIIHLNLLQKRYEKGERNINVNVKYQNMQSFNHKANLIHTSCENIAIHVNNPGITSYDRVEFPVTLHMTRSGTINIHFQNNAYVSDTIAARTASDGFIIYERRLDSYEDSIQDLSRTEKITKMRLRGIDNTITEPPAVIRQTPSGNYDIILEKEFEKYYKQAIKHQDVDENGSFFEILNTPSGIVLDFGKNDHVISGSRKALLIKSHSGILKIIVSDMEQNIKENMAQKIVPSCGLVMSAKALCQLLRKLPSTQTKFQTSASCNTSATRSRTRSDSQLYEAWKSMIRSNQSILEKSSTTLKKTKSGQYVVVLDKDSKKSFINNLIPYIDKSSKGVIPIKHTESGEITIVLSKDMNNIGENGSLKITTSGNIYIILDENAINRISNNVAVNTSNNVKKSEFPPYISKIENPENKAIATNCNARPDGNLCDSSKCVCERYDIKDIYFRRSWDEDNTFCGNSKCSACDKQVIKSNNKSPHIVIKPSECRPVPDKRNKLYESYYCEVQSICSYHKDRYEAVSNELLEISSLCNRPQKEVLSNIRTQVMPAEVKPIKQKKIVQPMQDSLEYLPHQLPPFLRNITYE